MIPPLAHSTADSLYRWHIGGESRTVVAGAGNTDGAGVGASPSSLDGDVPASQADWNGGYAKALGQSSLGSGASAGLSPEAQRQLNQLKETDRKVRAHEQAHMAAGGALVRGGASYTYQKGPDGRLYSVGGEVSIDVSPGQTPQETLGKAEQVRAAALAPSDPSAQLAAEARAELAAQASQGKRGGDASAETMVTEGDGGKGSSSVAAIAQRLGEVYAASGESQGLPKIAVSLYA